MTTEIRTLAVETDTELFPFESEIFMLEYGIRKARKSMSATGYRRPTPLMIESYEEQILKAQVRIEELTPLAAPLQAIYAANLWTRFILVPAGHLHRGTGCSTLRWNTERYALPEYSGADETEIVGLAGERACTVCFPSAPVDRPSMLPVDVAAREAAAKERAEKAAKLTADAHKFMSDDRKPVKIAGERFMTIRGAENRVGWLVECAIRSLSYEPADEAHRLQLIGNAASDMREAREVAQAVEQRTAQFGDPKLAQELLSKKYAAKRKEAIKNGWAAENIVSFDSLLALGEN